MHRDHQRSPRLIAAITSTGQSRTYWPERHRARAYSAYRHQLCCKAAKLQLGPRLLKQVRWNTNTRCGRVLTALKAAATAATRTRHTRAALAERRDTAEHSMQAAAPPPASDPASTKKQRSAARDERTSIGNLSEKLCRGRSVILVPTPHFYMRRARHEIARAKI